MRYLEATLCVYLKSTKTPSSIEPRLVSLKQLYRCEETLERKWVEEAIIEQWRQILNSGAFSLNKGAHGDICLVGEVRCHWTTVDYKYVRIKEWWNEAISCP